MSSCMGATASLFWGSLFPTNVINGAYPTDRGHISPRPYRLFLAEPSDDVRSHEAGLHGARDGS